MSDNNDQEVGAAHREYAKADAEFKKLTRETIEKGNFLCSLGEAIGQSDPTSPKLIDAKGNAVAFKDYPTKEALADLIQGLRNAKIKRQEAHSRLKGLGYEPK